MPTPASPKDQLRTLGLIADKAAATDDLDTLLGPVLRDVGYGTGLERVSLGLLDAARTSVSLVAAHGLTPAEVKRGRYALGEGLLGRALQAAIEHGNTAPVTIPSIRHHPHFLNRTGALEPGVDRGFVCVPLLHRGTPLGALTAYRRAIETHRLSEDASFLAVVATLLVPAVLQQEHARTGDSPTLRPPDILGSSRPMQAVFSAIQQVAASPTTVLVTGESGTGKELVAESIHKQSDRRASPFVAVNCAALPDGVIESELFGHERGAFTGAVARRKGRFELADGGTLFLDEIGDLSPTNQIKLLRVLQERQFERLGGNTPVRVDVRVITATSRDLEKMVADGRFRADLYYRLNVFPIHLPPLRERVGDITLLVDHFVDRFNQSHGCNIQRVSTSVIDMLTAYHWPGNVRELENCIERAVVVSGGPVLDGHHLPPTLQTAEATNTRTTGTLRQRLDDVERAMILDALKSSRGNQHLAAEALGLTDRVMGLRIQRYAIDPRRFKPHRDEETNDPS